MTGSFGQNSDAAVHPSVISRFLSQSTLGQKTLVSSTSVKPAARCSECSRRATASDDAAASMKAAVHKWVFPYWTAFLTVTSKWQLQPLMD